MAEDLENNCTHCRRAGENRQRSWQDEKTVRGLLNRLNRIEGQVRGVKRMIEEGAYCDDVLNQIASIQAALNGAARVLLEKHVKNCIKEQIRAGDDDAVEELMKTLSRLINRS